MRKAENLFAWPLGADYGLCVSVQEITEAVLQLPERERLEVARRILASLDVDQSIGGQIAQAVRGIEDVLTGKVQGLSEAEFRDALR